MTPDGSTRVTEEWRPVLGYEGTYEVSTFGRVRSLPRVIVRSNGQPQTIRGCVRSLKPGKRGYPVVSLKRPGLLLRLVPVHRLVADAFLAREPHHREVRHLDGNKLNNAVTNLAWGTASENHADRVTHGTSNRGERNGLAKLTRAQVREIRRLRRSGWTQRAIGKRFGIAREHVRDITNGKKWAWLA